MKHNLFLPLFLPLGLLIWGCSRDNAPIHEHGHGHNHEQEHSAHKHEHDGHEHDDHEAEEDHDGLIVISPVDAETMGVRATEVTRGNFHDVNHISGIVENYPTDVYTAVSKSKGVVKLSPTLLLGNHVNAGTLLATVSGSGISGGDDNAVAYNQMITAQRELDRLRPLHAEGIVSTRDFNAAEAVYREAQAVYSGSKSGSSIVSGIGGTVTEILVSDGSFVDVGDPIAVISKSGKVMLRVDLPTRLATKISSQDGGMVKFVGASDKTYSFEELNAKRQSQQAVKTAGAYIPLYYLINNPGGLVPGMVADVYLASGTRDDVVSVPLSAVSEQQGINFVYIKLDEDCYKKQPVVLGASDGHYVEVKSGINEGHNVVTEGMIFVKLAESNGAVPEGHSHTH